MTNNIKLDLHKQINERLDNFYLNNNIPHIIFYGSPGSGKKTIMYNFLNKIYDNDKQKLKSNIMVVNCCHGKGIKFIREELKFFAQTNLQYKANIKFKSIILLNADSLTNDAQSALRRCIELFSNNTRFFIIVENKERLLNPILSRFCDIYVPEYIHNGKVVNLHTHILNQKFDMSFQEESKKKWFEDNMDFEVKDHRILLQKTNDIYEKGYSCIDLMNYINTSDEWDATEKSTYMLCFNKVKPNFRCEKLLLFFMMDFVFMKADESLDIY